EAPKPVADAVLEWVRATKGTPIGPCSRRLGRLLQKLYQGGAVLGRADPLLRHLGAGRVGHRSDLEQLRDRFRRPHDIELLERVGKIIAAERRDPSSENARDR